VALQDADSRQTAEKERQRRESAEKQAARAPARALAATLQSRGWRIGRPQITIGEYSLYLFSRHSGEAPNQLLELDLHREDAAHVL